MLRWSCVRPTCDREARTVLLPPFADDVSVFVNHPHATVVLRNETSVRFALPTPACSPKCFDHPPSPSPGLRRTTMPSAVIFVDILFCVNCRRISCWLSVPAPRTSGMSKPSCRTRACTGRERQRCVWGGLHYCAVAVCQDLH